MKLGIPLLLLDILSAKFYKIIYVIYIYIIIEAVKIRIVTCIKT